MTNHLPLKVSKDEASGWSFEWDADALVLQAKEGLPEDMDAVYVGCLNVEIEGHEQEVGGFASEHALWVSIKAKAGVGGGQGGLQSPDSSGRLQSVGAQVARALPGPAHPLQPALCTLAAPACLLDG